jgi:UrcA family protein
VTAVTAAVGLAMISQPAAATTRAGPEVNVRKVFIADLDLTRDRDAAILVERVNRAARTVCTGSYDDWQQFLTNSSWYRACVRQASGQAVASLDNPRVTALHQGGPAPIRLAANGPQD